MGETPSLSGLIESLTSNAVYRRALTKEIEARTADQGLVERLVAYARSREVSTGHAIVRKMLTEAGISWEAR